MKNLQRTYLIKSSPEDVFNAMTNPLTLELWTGYPATFQPESATEFTLWDGDIMGMNLEILPDKKLVQEWYFEDNKEPSIVTIELTKLNEKTQIELHHTNIPNDAFSNIAEGWNKYYFGTMKKYLESK
ncbi:MAG: SRPBCC domain-containing protein [Bacteroidales bacterium]|nr:SRPBCC domain-containing protein [Bacteroidales bacterium]